MIPQTTREMAEANATDESNKLRARKANNNVPSDEFRKRGRATRDNQQQLAGPRGGTRRIVADEITLGGNSGELKGEPRGGRSFR